MTDKEAAINYVLANEGNLSEDAKDPGGITKYGISLRFLREIPSDRLKVYGVFEPITENTIRELTISQAKLIYAGEFWSQAPFDRILNQAIGNYLFDMCVNHGMGQGIKMLQRALCACEAKRDYVKDDGILGDDTIAAVNRFCFMLLPAMRSQRDEYYRHLAALNPKQQGELDGWLNRCYR